MIWFGKSSIKFVRALLNLLQLVSTLTCNSARIRVGNLSLLEISKANVFLQFRYYSEK